MGHMELNRDSELTFYLVYSAEYTCGRGFQKAAWMGNKGKVGNLVSSVSGRTSTSTSEDIGFRAESDTTGSAEFALSQGTNPFSLQQNGTDFIS